MRRSLQRRLSLMLGGATLLAAFLATLASFGLAYQEAREFQDDMLRQIALLASARAHRSAQTNPQREAGQNENISDPESLVVVTHLPGDNRPSWLDGNLSPGFHTLNAGTKRLRVFILDGPAGARIAVSQPTESRDEIAINSALRTLVPLLLLLPVMAWLIVRIVRAELAPVNILALRLDEQAADRLLALADDNVPREIMPFVQAINRLLGRTNQALDQQRRFIADAAHELRTPLTALSVQIQNLKQAESLDAVRERVLPLESGIVRARQVTEQLLSLARTQAGSAEEPTVEASLMARELIAEYLPLAESKDIDLGLDTAVPEKIHRLPATVRLIIRNALENALNYTPAGGQVTLRLSSDDDETVIEVTDNGPGIPENERERVFDPFYRITGTPGTGSGLGLAIAQETAARLGGKISLCQGTNGRGLLFRYQQRHQK